MEKVLGCGIDIEELNRFNSKIPTHSEHSAFAEMVYSDAEIQNNLAIKPYLTFPLGFSCKEAFFKAVGVSWTNSNISWKDIELIFNDDNNLHDFTIRLSGYARILYDKIRCRNITSSLEYNNEFVIFKVILLS